MDTSLIEIIIGFIGGGGLTALVTLPITRRKAKTETDSAIIQEWERLYARLDTEVKANSKEIERVRQISDQRYHAIMQAYRCHYLRTTEGASCMVLDDLAMNYDTQNSNGDADNL